MTCWSPLVLSIVSGVLLDVLVCGVTTLDAARRHDAVPRLFIAVYYVTLLYQGCPESAIFNCIIKINH